MPTNKEAKKELWHEEWAEQIAECQSSGMSVKEWCKSKGLRYSTYYSHLRIVRMELHKKAEHPMQKIVPISIAEELSGTTVPAASQSSVINASRESIVMRKDGIEIELPQSISEDTILALLRGLKQC